MTRDEIRNTRITNAAEQTAEFSRETAWQTAGVYEQILQVNTLLTQILTTQRETQKLIQQARTLGAG